MGSRRLFARGSHGEIVRSVQKELTRRGFDTRGVDGVFGVDTAKAVTLFQASGGLEVSSTIDVETWSALMQAPPPPVRDRALGVTAAIEGHGFSLAQGNFDGAGITWGIIGFTLRHGELSRIILETCEANPALIRDLFGDRSEELIGIMKAPWSDQLRWADSISLGTKKVNLAEPWKSCFGFLGEDPGVQQLQLRIVNDDYFVPAVSTATSQGLNTELGVALALDIQVQNGGIKAAAKKQIAQTLAATPPSSERDIRIVIADAVADHSSKRWRDDVRKRKRTIATGIGEVHGMKLRLVDWGLDELAF